MPPSEAGRNGSGGGSGWRGGEQQRPLEALVSAPTFNCIAPRCWLCDSLPASQMWGPAVRCTAHRGLRASSTPGDPHQPSLCARGAPPRPRFALQGDGQDPRHGGGPHVDAGAPRRGQDPCQVMMAAAQPASLTAFLPHGTARSPRSLSLCTPHSERLGGRRSAASEPTD